MKNLKNFGIHMGKLQPYLFCAPHTPHAKNNEKTNVGPIAGLNEYIDLDHME